ncbi:DNA polymerase I [Cellulosilyticum sp. I15G10I2]|uniref:DNA polymerase I n=1 Tax=Cellulosilyticum sp. I15G10I2 TaxID=1892843 RepID=UPI00085C546D|nr:DNA polymerase I [Cellulosilyticum sp. I15G10I2]
MKQKLLLFDGHSIANRAFYGVPLLTNKQGIYTNAVFGFINMMLGIIEKEKPDFLGVTFDLSAPTFRHEFSKDYKGNRKGMPEELRTQIPLLKKALKLLDIFIIEKEGYEADDVLGTLAKAAEKDDMEVIVVSGDRDLFQITSDRIQVKIPRTKKTGTEIESFFGQTVQDTYGVTPKQFIDVKGLMGDPSDNIKGVPGVGEKTAVKLIQEYGSVENLLDNLDHIKQKKLKENLVTYANDARDSKMLATIVCDVPLSYQWDNFTYDLTLNEEAYELFKELEFRSLLNKLPRSVRKEDEQPLDIMIWDEKSFSKFLEASKHQEIGVSYYVEQNKLGFAFSSSSDLGCFEINLPNEAGITLIEKFFTSGEYQKIIHNSKVLRHQLYKAFNMQVEEVVFDTFIAAYLLNPTNPTYDIAEIQDMFLGASTIGSMEDLLGKGKAQKEWKDLDLENRVMNLCKRAHIIREAHQVMNARLSELNMNKLFYEIEMPLIEVLFNMEVQGITVDIEQLKEYGNELQLLIDSISQEIYNEVGESFNINSPKQLGIILFEKMGIPAVKKTKTGYSTAAEVLETLKNDYPVIQKILEFRQYIKLKSTYVDGLINVLGEDQKIHSTFNQTITATGRLSSTEPNLQNIPVKFEMGRKIRKMFIPSSEEYVFLDGDYSQIELRVLAHMAQDTTLIDAFKNNIDIHALTASQVFHVNFEEVTPLQRSNAKAVNFGIVYGISAFSLSEDLKITQKAAQKYIEGYFDKYPKVKQYLDDTIDFAMQNGYVTTLFNRKREIPEILASNYNMREFGKRVAMNTPIQGTSADIIKIAMIKVYKKLKAKGMKSKLILTVHDELLIETHKTEIEAVKSLLKHEMENSADLLVPLSVDVHKGKNWLEVK